MKRRRLWLIILILVAAGLVMFFLPEQTVVNGSVSGIQVRSQRWSGTIRITGDVQIVPWKVLTIEPGTTIAFDKRPDIPDTKWTLHADEYIKSHDDPTGRSGYKKSHYSLVAKFTAIGTLDEPIVFTSSQSEPDYADWDELIAFSESIFDRVEVAYAHNGINANGKNVTVTNSRIHDSLWSCVDIFSWGATVTNNDIYHCWHQAIGIKTDDQTKAKNVVTGNAIRDSNLSVNCEGTAMLTLEQNQFFSAPIAENCRELLGAVSSVNTVNERRADTPGGTYGGRLIYPAN